MLVAMGTWPGRAHIDSDKSAAGFGTGHERETTHTTSRYDLSLIVF